jgi:hypothetical protein
VYEDLHRPLTRLDTAVGYDRDEIKLEVITYEQMRPGSYSVPDRLADMDVNHVQSALCFPTFPRFCGQTFTEAGDRELGLLGVRAYNDWMVEEWCGPEARGRLIPLTLIPLWDADLAAEEVRRNAARGVRAVAFSEIPPHLGLPSIHTDYWDPFLRACDETGTVVAMHIGSSSRMPSTSADAPPAVGSTITFANCCFSLVDWLMSGKSCTRRVRSAGSRTSWNAPTWSGRRTAAGAASRRRCCARRRSCSRGTCTGVSSTTPSG